MAGDGGLGVSCRAVVLLGCVVLLPLAADAQGRGAVAQAAAQASARAAAPRDFTGYWVAVVTEHWHLRMMMPPKGEYALLPLTAEGRKVADAWDPARDRTTGQECRGYGAAAIMRVPGRVYIHWADDNTLQIDTDTGTQTRLLKFGGAPSASAGAPQWQGQSAAAWQGAGARGGRGNGQLRAVTTHMRAGYLRKNGVPYSENARLEEFFETFTEPNGDSWLVVTSVVTDPRYLTQPYAATYPFKKIPDRSGWDPTPCRVEEVR